MILLPEDAQRPYEKILILDNIPAGLKKSRVVIVYPDEDEDDLCLYNAECSDGENTIGTDYLISSETTEFNPHTEKTSYHYDAKVCRDYYYEQYGTILK